MALVGTLVALAVLAAIVALNVWLGRRLRRRGHRRHPGERNKRWYNPDPNLGGGGGMGL